VLRLGQTLAMVLTRDEGADSALVVAITCEPADQAARNGEKPGS
jgi:hypothetical protein